MIQLTSIEGWGEGRKRRSNVKRWRQFRKAGGGKGGGSKFISSPLAEYQCRLFQTFLFGTFLIDFCTNSTHFFCTINGVIGSRGSADNKNLVRGMNYLGREFRLSHFEFFKGLFERGGGGNIDMDERPKRVKCNIVTVMDLYIRSVVSNISKCFSLQRG